MNQSLKKGDVIRRKDDDGLEWTVEDVHKDGYYTIVCADRDDFIQLDDKWELVEQKSAEEYNITGIGSKNAQGKLGEIIKKLKPVNKVLEQKPSGKIEPKFKVGDWCIDNEDGIIFQITNVLGNIYTYRTNEGKDYFCTHYSLENDCHLWTVEDVKNGDVLASHECIVLFKEVDGLNIKCHCTYHFMNNPSFYINTLQNKSAFHPATKEQREILLKAMADAGFTFDFEKKELKKIESKTAEWNEEDKDALGMAIIALDDMYDPDEPNNTYAGYSMPFDKAVERLKSLRPQKKWKPSDEQIKALSIAMCGVDDPLFSLYQDLKKL